MPGKWRDFQSTVFASDVLTDLNRAARTGATSQELEGLAGLERHAPHTRQQIAASHETYADFTKRLAALVAVKLGTEEEKVNAESH